MDGHYENISPLDGRYRSLTREVSCFFSEFALISYRIMVEIEYFIKLSQTLGFEVPIEQLRMLYKSVNQAYIARIKAIENVTSHDVKAVEYFLREKFHELNIKYAHFIHFGLTSQDINNTALSLSVLDYLNEQFFRHVENLGGLIQDKANKWMQITMLSRTHGQPGVPTSLGKEMKVFSYRLHQQYTELRNIKVYSKFGGASGNLNAHYFAYPDVDWVQFGQDFLESFNLKKSEVTTQIDNYDNLSQILDAVKRVCTILIDFTRDIWHYISIEYLVQSYVSNEVGSSTMPHKINPINFENAEGNLMIAVSLLEFLSRKLPISRLQRDLTDSTVTRNVGVAFGHIAVSYANIVKGLNKIQPNVEKIYKDLDENVAVLTEGIQTLMRKHGDEEAYDKLKLFSRNHQRITLTELHDFIQTLNVPEDARRKMIGLNMHNYTGTST